MAEINYQNLVGELVKPLVTRPSCIVISEEIISEKEIAIKVQVHPTDLGRVIGKHGRVASAIRTLAHAAATRNEEVVSIEFTSLE